MAALSDTRTLFCFATNAYFQEMKIHQITCAMHCPDLFVRMMLIVVLSTTFTFSVWLDGLLQNRTSLRLSSPSPTGIYEGWTHVDVDGLGGCGLHNPHHITRSKFKFTQVPDRDSWWLTPSWWVTKPSILTQRYKNCQRIKVWGWGTRGRGGWGFTCVWTQEQMICT